jgi:hypothetical protein
MRAGLVFSAVGHLALLVWGFVLFASPKQFAPIPPESIIVDIVPAAAMAQDLEQPRAENAPAQQQSAPDREQPAAQKPAENPQSSSASAAPPPSAQAQPPGPREPVQARPPQPEPPPPPPPPPNLLVFNPTVAPVPELPLPLGDAQNPAEGFDAPADSRAKLSREEIEAFRAHLQKCWNPPAAVADAQKLKVVLRVALQPNGALTGSPTLIEASASAHGPALVATAVSALRACQPYGFLPAARYQEWKLLDLSFSPRGMAGG